MTEPKEYNEPMKKKINFTFKNEMKEPNKIIIKRVGKMSSGYNISIINSPTKVLSKSYEVNQLMKLNKVNEIIKVHCFLDDIQFQNDCILIFKICDVKDPEVTIYGKFWTRESNPQYLSKMECHIMGRLIFPKVENKEPIFNCIWIGNGKENI
ncbi:hypothetical protein EDI_292890 [Entamoeba dispar SAW760]|uniref:Uncharacterized protein n=1 Tax=Entamoeba dispar (strain ATCC PRA-260 / SAW760) TaxID=370354 RepID=B0EEW7_ENTDS|nr:uncharacterized protein EDI_292890 [Entamoeba dispar SAW760]EDR26927.1 hypothetical protein EDI_292890 [Entamoeba dispar SAW760]|eukprot:EDR26927.1 hypothetical protein EDI_292890 [Entamoeba dispar SAW760]